MASNASFLARRGIPNLHYIERRVGDEPRAGTSNAEFIERRVGDEPRAGTSNAEFIERAVIADEEEDDDM